MKELSLAALSTQAVKCGVVCSKINTILIAVELEVSYLELLGKFYENLHENLKYSILISILPTTNYI